MNNLNKTGIFSLLLIAVAMLTITSCKKDDDIDPNPNTTSGNRSFVIEAKIENDNTAPNNLLVVDDIESGTASIVNAVELQSNSFIRKNLHANGPLANGANFIVHQDNKFIKYGLDQNNQIEELASAPRSTGRPSVWTDDNRFVTFNDNFSYEVFNFETFTQESSGQLTEPVAAGRDAWAGCSFMHNNKIYLGYGDINNNTFADTLVGFLVLDPISLQPLDTLRDYRTVGVGQPNLNHSFKDGGYTYFLAMPSGWWFNRPDKPSAIMRITPSGEIDPNFLFNISEKIGGTISGTNNYRYHADGEYYFLGNGKFLVRVFDEQKITQYSDYYQPQNGVYSLEHYVADINAGTVTKLNVPASFGPYANMVEYDNKIAFPVNTSSGAFIYVYDKTSGQVSQGLKVEGASTISTIKVINK